MPTVLIDEAAAPVNSAAITGVAGLRIDRVFVIAITGDASVVIQVSPNGTDWFDLYPPVTSSGTVLVPAQITARVAVESVTGTVTAWVA